MTSEDRDLLLALRRQQEDLQQSLAQLNAQLSALENRAASEVVEEPGCRPPPLPPIPSTDGAGQQHLRFSAAPGRANRGSSPAPAACASTAAGHDHAAALF